MKQYDAHVFDWLKWDLRLWITAYQAEQERRLLKALRGE